MQRFIRHIIIFTGILLVASALVLTSFFIFHTRRVKAKMQTIAGYECLIMGDSQMQRIRPDAFTAKTFNFASSGEHYYFTYQKIRELLSMPRSEVKKIILGVSAHNFAPVYDKLFDPESPEGQSSLKRYFYFIRLPGAKFIRFRDIIGKNFVQSVISSPDYGGFLESHNANPDTVVMDKTLYMHFGDDTIPKVFCESQVLYLRKIVALCREHHIDLLMVSTPYHPYYLSRIDDHYFDMLNKTLSEFNEVPYLNLIDPHISPAWMSDANHLNYKGARYYSKRISRMIGE